MSGWSNPLDLLTNELNRRPDEGCTIPEALVDAIAALPNDGYWDRARIDPLYDQQADG